MFLSLTFDDAPQDVRQDIAKYITQNAATIENLTNSRDILVFYGVLRGGAIDCIAKMMKYGEEFGISPDSKRMKELHRMVADAETSNNAEDTIVKFFAFDEKEIPIFVSLFRKVCEELKHRRDADPFDILESDRDMLRRKMTVVYGTAPLEECMMQLANAFLKGKSN